MGWLIRHAVKPRSSGRGYKACSSFTYPQTGFKLGSKLQLSKAGNLKIKLHRELRGEIKTVSIRRENGNWYACFSCVVAAEPLPVLSNSTGIDVGLETFATLSNGKKIENPRWYGTAERRLRRAQRKVARRMKGRNRRRKAVALLAQVHKDIFNKRNDFQHKESRKLVQAYGTIFAEDLNMKGLSQGLLAKSVHDASWASFLDKISYKAENAGRRFVRVNPRGTSQRCLCGADNPKKLANRKHV